MPTIIRATSTKTISGMYGRIATSHIATANGCVQVYVPSAICSDIARATECTYAITMARYSIATCKSYTKNKKCEVNASHFFYLPYFISLPYFPALALRPRITAEVKPACSISLRPLMVIPPAVVTLSISCSGCEPLRNNNSAAPFNVAATI